MSKEEKKQLKKGILIIIVLLLIIIGMISGTYALYQLRLKGKEENVIRAANLALMLDETTSDGINLVTAIPVSNETGEKYDAYTFKLVNEGDIDSNYTIYLEDLQSIANGTESNRTTINSNNRMSDAGVKFNLKTKKSSDAYTNNGSALLTTLEGSNTGKRKLDSGTIGVGETYEYELRLWIDENATLEQVNAKIFAANLNIDATLSVK